jgi:glycosyltransferase involved in cell wall biosynthesis
MAGNMNILYINHYAGSIRHGMALRSYYLAKEWVKTGDNKVMIASASFSHLRRIQPEELFDGSEESIDGIDYLWIKTRSYSSNGLSRFVNLLQFILGLFRKAEYISETFSPDVVIASSAYPMDIWPAKAIAKKSNAKLVFEIRDVWPQSLIEAGGLHPFHPFVFLAGLAEKSVYRSAGWIVSLLPAVHEHCRSHGYDSTRITVVPNGIDEAEWSAPSPLLIPEDIREVIETAKKNKCRIICYTGAHGVPNDLDNLLDAAKLMEGTSVIFLLIGHGNHKVNLSSRVLKEKIDNVHLFDSVPKSVIPSVLNAVDFGFIGAKKQPLYKHGVSPNKLMDYMVSGIPILFAITAGNDPVSDAQCGLSIEPGNSLALCLAIEQLMVLSQDEIDDMGNRGRAFAFDNYTYPMLANKFIKALDF